MSTQIFGTQYIYVVTMQFLFLEHSAAKKITPYIVNIQTIEREFSFPDGTFAVNAKAPMVYLLDLQDCYLPFSINKKANYKTRSLPKNAVRAENKILLSCDR